MKIIAMDKLKPGVSFEQIRPHLREEAQAVWIQYRKGIYRELYFRQDGAGVVFVLECADAAEAKRHVSELPLVKEGLIEFEFIPLGPFHLFSTLFREPIESD